VIKDGKVMIVDENTGRIMDGRRYSDGIHQAIEAKENVHIQQESKTLASITYQNLFRKFPKLSGMTGTAMTEKEEFMSIYGLDVVTVPTNKPMIRNDRNDKVYISHKAKLNAIVARVKMCQAKGQPILIGTTSVESSEEISSLFKKHGIKHVVLNAKHHADEAKIVAQAGKLGAVTIATNMAGRGTDIILGGNPEYLALEELRKEGYPEELIIEATSHFETDNADILDIREKFKEKETRIKEELAPEVQQVLEAGGLFILGSERHESRRIDNQLRGRSGRQGDMGESEFILSLEDNLMRLFGADKILNLVHTMNLPEEEPIQAGLLSNSIEKAQARVEGQYFAMRKSVLQFDEVLARQRDIVYSERIKLLNKEVDCIETATKMMLNTIKVKAENLLSQKKYIEAEDIDNLKDSFSEFDGMITIKDYSNEELDTLTVEDIVEDLSEQLKENLNEFISLYDEQYMSETFRRIILFLLDNAWQEHMVILDDLKQGINLNAYAQRDPLTTFKVESFELFDEMMLYIQEETLKTFYRMRKTMFQQ
jgi:preprotein translocase subunit SecA